MLTFLGEESITDFGMGDGIFKFLLFLFLKLRHIECVLSAILITGASE